MGCNEQKNKHQPNLNKQKAHISPVSYVDVDTVFMSHAPSAIVRKIRQNLDGNLLIATYTDVIEFDGKTFSPLPKPKGLESFDAFDAMQDSKGILWIASTHFGLFRFNGKEFTHFTTENGLANNRIMDILEDKTGKIWIATFNGVSRFDGVSFQNFTQLNGLSNNEVNTIFEDKSGKIWFGTRGKTSFYEPISATFTELISIDTEPLLHVRTILEDNNGSIWFGAEKGIWRYTSTSLMKVSNKSTHAIFEDNKSTLWFTSKNELFTISNNPLSPNEFIEKTIFTNQGMIFGISEDKDGKIWIGTLDNVFTYNGNLIQFYLDSK